MELREHLNERGLVLRGVDPREFWLHRFAALCVGRFLVHARAVKVSNLLRDRIPSRCSQRRFLQNVPHRVLVALVEFDKAEPRRLVSRNLSVLHPAPAGVLIEISARVGCLIDVVDAETLRACRFRSRNWCSLRNGEGEHN